MTTVRQAQVRRRGWLVAGAAAAAVMLGVGAYVVGTNGGPDAAGGGTAVTLSMPGSGGTAMQSCLPFSVKLLHDMPLAFAGRATSVTDNSVTLKVDRWYRGGTAKVVELAHYDPRTVSIGGIEFTKGQKYLITATNGTVNVCGFSGSWTPDLAENFDSAFTP